MTISVGFLEEAETVIQKDTVLVELPVVVERVAVLDPAES